MITGNYHRKAEAVVRGTMATSTEKRTLLLFWRSAFCLCFCLYFEQVLGADQCYCRSGCKQCTGDCFPGWAGPTCTSNCSKHRNCSNVCGCKFDCACDKKTLICNQTLCSRKYPDGTNWLTEIGSIAAIAILSGAISMVLLAILYSIYNFILLHARTRKLRGFLLSMPCFVHCPGFRDWLQRKGEKFGLKGLRLGVRDSLDNIAFDGEIVAHNQHRTFRVWHREQAKVIGVRDERQVTDSATSGYRWKRKWRDRKVASKKRRKLKHEQRKLRRQGDKGERKESIILPPVSASYVPNLSLTTGYARRGSRFDNLLFRRGSIKKGAQPPPLPKQPPTVYPLDPATSGSIGSEKGKLPNGVGVDRVESQSLSTSSSLVGSSSKTDTSLPPGFPDPGTSPGAMATNLSVTSATVTPGVSSSGPSEL